MRLVIIPSDSIVIIDGKLFKIDCSSIDSSIHAVQWYTDHGTIEYSIAADGTLKPNLSITDITQFQTVIDLWNAANALPPVVVIPPISDRQFFQQLAVQGIITQAEALASNAAVIPPELLALVNNMPVDQQFNAKMIISGAVVFYRNNPLTIAIGQAYGMTSTQMDQFFLAAALL
jgi:hypothetical protein